MKSLFEMSASADIAAIRRRFSAIGAALMRANLNNTHSGNMSLRDPDDPGRFYVTASGSQCGALAPGDIVPVRFSDLGWEGTARPSSETNTHRRVLSLPGVNACVHCHSVASTLASFDSPEQPVLLTRLTPEHDGDTRCFFQPVDFFGAGLLGTVPVGIYRNPVGSAEMEERIPRHLEKSPVTLVAGHGPFARGRSLAECLQHPERPRKQRGTAARPAAPRHRHRRDSGRASFQRGGGRLRLPAADIGDPRASRPAGG